jgi:hypothetical protein
MRTRTIRSTPQAWAPSGDGLSGLNRAFRDSQVLMVAPGVLASWAMRASLRSNGIAFCDNDARDASLTSTTRLTTAHVNRREARLGNVTIHRTLQIANVGHMWEHILNLGDEICLHYELAWQIVPAGEER